VLESKSLPISGGQGPSERENKVTIYKLDAAEAAERIRVMSMGGEPRPRLKDDLPKLAPNGKATYSSGVVAAREDGGQDKGVTIAVTEPKVYSLGTILRPEGDVWLTPYVSENGGRASAGMSIIAERLVPVDAPVAPARSRTE